MPIIPDISKKLKEALKLEANFKEILNGNFNNVKINSIQKPEIFIQKITEEKVAEFKEKFGGK